MNKQDFVQKKVFLLVELKSSATIDYVLTSRKLASVEVSGVEYRLTTMWVNTSGKK